MLETHRDEFSDFLPHSYSLVLHLTLLLMLCLTSLMDLTIADMILVHERIALCLDALVTVHVLIMVIISHVGLVPRHLHSPQFPHRGSRPIGSNGDMLKTVKTSSGRMVKC
jgi:hypothetical protein